MSFSDCARRAAALAARLGWRPDDFWAATPADLLNALEFGAAATLTDPNRAELMARFKSA